MNLIQFIKYLMNEGDVQNLSINDLPTNLQATPSIEKSEEQKSKDWVKNFIKSLKKPYINKPNSKTLKPQKTQSENSTKYLEKNLNEPSINETNSKTLKPQETQSENSTRESALKSQKVISKKIDQEQDLEH